MGDLLGSWSVTNYVQSNLQLSSNMVVPAYKSAKRKRGTQIDIEKNSSRTKSTGEHDGIIRVYMSTLWHFIWVRRKNLQISEREHSYVFVMLSGR